MRRAPPSTEEFERRPKTARKSEIDRDESNRLTLTVWRHWRGQSDQWVARQFRLTKFWNSSLALLCRCTATQFAGTV